jgi:hypothetical protein
MHLDAGHLDACLLTKRGRGTPALRKKWDPAVPGKPQLRIRRHKGRRNRVVEPKNSLRKGIHHIFAGRVTSPAGTVAVEDRQESPPA